MKIEFNVTQNDIDTAKEYSNTRGCLGCVVLNRVLDITAVHCGGTNFSIDCIRNNMRFSEEFANYLWDTIRGKVKPRTFSQEIPDKVLEQIGYFDKKGNTFVDDYTTKENNIEDKINHDGHQVVKACQD